ncbi:MAG: hypothetical protein QN178_14260 [Armatimonadota bacterium]|nr:hypothetical protein [Armatimonadota bacterium]
MAVLRGAIQPLVIEVLAPSLIGVGFPRTVGDSTGRRAPGRGDVGSEDAYRLLRLLDRLRDEFGNDIVVHLIEPLSFGWIVRVLRHRPRRYPVFLVGGRASATGLDEATLRAAILTALRRRR